MDKTYRKIIRSWAMYDFANSTYSLVIATTLLPAYYLSIVPDQYTLWGYTFINSELYNYLLGIAFTIVMLILPFTSAIADAGNSRKKFMFFFYTLGSLACAMLFFFNSNHIHIGLLATIIASVGWNGSLVFYNSFLPDIAPEQERDRVSALGYTYGYIGSVVLQVICFALVMFSEQLGFENKAVPVRLSFVLVALWWWGFGNYSLRNLPNGTNTPGGNRVSYAQLFRQAIRTLRNNYSIVKHEHRIKKFLLIFSLSNFGVQAIIYIAAIYATQTLQIAKEYLMLIIILIQLVAIPGAIIFSKMSDKIGNYKTLLVINLIWMLVCLAGYYAREGSKLDFTFLACIIGLGMGAIQSLNRSTYSKIIPAIHDVTSMFSFYEFVDKFSIVCSMFCFGILQHIFGSMRASIMMLGVAFAAASFLLILEIFKSRKNKLLII